MIDLSTAPRTRLFTSFGTALYVDRDSGELRHGPVGTIPANAMFVADASSAEGKRHGWLMLVSGDSQKPLICSAARCHTIAGNDPSVTPTLLELVQLERGLITFRAGNVFLSAIPNGQVRVCAPKCSTWELFLGSEDWCANAAAGYRQTRY